MRMYTPGEITTEIRAATQGFTRREGSRFKIDYPKGGVSYVTSVSFFYNGPEAPAPDRIGPGSKLLLGRRPLSQHWGGVSGYVDTIDGEFGPIDNPVLFTAHEELREEVGLDPAIINEATFYFGGRFAVNGGQRHVLPVAAVWAGESEPAVTPDGVELDRCRFVSLRDIANVQPRSINYAERALPCALGSTGISMGQYRAWTGVQIHPDIR